MTSDFHGSQSSCCGDSSFPGGEECLVKHYIKGSVFYFPLQQIIHEKNTNPDIWKEYSLTRRRMLKVLKTDRDSRTPQSLGNFCEITVKAFEEGAGGYWMYSCSIFSGNGESKIPPLLCTALLSAWSNLAGALRHANSSILNPSRRLICWQTASLFRQIKNNLVK